MERRYSDTLKKLHFDMHTPSFVPNVGDNLDIEKFVEAVKLSGTQSITFFARCAYGFCYFPTKYGKMHPNLKRDIFGEICTALRKEEIDVTAYFAVCRISDVEMKEQPEKQKWISKDENGENRFVDLQGDKVHTLCLTRGFLYEEILPEIIECATKYDINGIWIDGLYHHQNTPCYCDSCKATFNKEVPSGKGIFEGRVRDRWITDKIWQFLDTVADELKKVNPKLEVGSDVIGCLNWSIPHPKKIGFMTYDPQTPNLALNISQAMSYTGWRGIASDMNIQRMKNWQDFNCRSLEMLQTDAAVCASMNCMLIAGDIFSSITAHPNYEDMKLVSQMYAYGEKIYNQVKGIKQYADVAILSSPEVARNNTDGNWKTHNSNLMSAYQIILSKGLTAHTLFDDDLKDNIHKYSIVIIPELDFIGQNAGKVLVDYVKNGGKVLVIGDIPATVGGYELTENASYELMQQLCGVQRLGKYETTLSYLCPKESSLEKYLPNIPLSPFSISGNYIMTKATTAKVVEYVYNYGICYQFGALPIGDKTQYPAVTTNNYGKGEVTYLSQPFFTSYDKNGNHIVKNLVGNIIVDSIKPYAKLTGSSSAQLVVAKDENKVAVSVIVYHSDLRGSLPRIIDKVGEIANLKVRLNEHRTPKNVKSVMGDDIDFTCDDEGILIEYPPVKIYSGIVLEF